MRKIIISAFLAVLGMPIDMYGERRRRDLQVCRPNVQYMAGLGRAQGIRWHLNYIHSMKYAEVINASIAANSAGIDYSLAYCVLKRGEGETYLWCIWTGFCVRCLNVISHVILLFSRDCHMIVMK